MSHLVAGMKRTMLSVLTLLRERLERKSEASDAIPGQSRQEFQSDSGAPGSNEHEPAFKTEGVRLRGAGWSYAFGEGETDTLATKLELHGHWALAFKMRRFPDVSLGQNEKEDLLDSLTAIEVSGNASATLSELAQSLRHDLSAVRG